MIRKWQFQNLALQEQLLDEPTAPLPIIESQTMDFPLALPETPLPATACELAPVQVTEVTNALTQESQATTPPVDNTMIHQKRRWRILLLTLGLLLCLALCVVWHSSIGNTALPPITTPTASTSESDGLSEAATTPVRSTTTDTSATIQVYVLGAIKHPGVYLLPSGARVYQLLQAAGGPLPDANLVALNLAAALTDGEEVYVLAIGETPPGNLNESSPTPSTSSTATVPTGQLLNINTATAAQMEQTLHVSSTTAAKIIAYRTQHGPYTAVDQLLQVVSEEIYKRIEPLVTV